VTLREAQDVVGLKRETAAALQRLQEARLSLDIAERLLREVDAYASERIEQAASTEYDREQVEREAKCEDLRNAKILSRDQYRQRAKDRDAEIRKLRMKGYTGPEIATQLGISVFRVYACKKQ
jgi:hypothetical protein